MLDLISIIAGILIGTVIQFYFPWFGKLMDIAQKHRPKEKTIHDIEIIPPKW